MIETPEIRETPAQLTAIIHLTIPRSEIRDAMGPGISELMTVVRTQGVGPAGPWFSHHLRMDAATFDFEISVPVSAPVTPAGRVVNGVRPAMRVVTTVYQGHYEGLGAAWAEFGKWIEANGYAIRPDLYECYLKGPESGPDPGEWRTELSRPLFS